MIYYVSASAYRDGDGSQARPFKRINDAARIAMPGDEVLVGPGVYHEYVERVARYYAPGGVEYVARGAHPLHRFYA